jgi:TetR/AcrR family transcriptional regulator, transcriptional repressor for nem operon
VTIVRQAPTTDRGRATLERILEAAAELFYRHGVRATGLDQISAASGTGKGQLYHYFADKSDLVRAVVARQIELVLDAQRPLLEQAAGWDDIDAWIELLVQAHEQPGDPFRCPIGGLVAELADADPATRAALASAFGRWTDLIAQALGGLREAGALQPHADCQALACALLAAYQGGLVLAQVSGDVGPLRASLVTARDGVREQAGVRAL